MTTCSARLTPTNEMRCHVCRRVWDADEESGCPRTVTPAEQKSTQALHDAMGNVTPEEWRKLYLCDPSPTLAPEPFVSALAPDRLR